MHVNMTPPRDIRPAPVTLREAFWYWLKLGFISFGGPAGQIALMHAELVERRRWISEQRFLHALNYCMLLPGPEATQLAVYIGWLMHKTRGGILAGVLFVLPSLLILIVLSWIYMAYGSLPAVAGIMYGIKPAVVAIVLAAAWRIGSRTLKNPVLIAIAVAAFLAIAVSSLPFPADRAGRRRSSAWPAAAGGRHWFQVGGKHPGSRASVRPRADRRRHADARPRHASPGRAWRASRWSAAPSAPAPGCCWPRASAPPARWPRWAGSSPRPPC